MSSDLTILIQKFHKTYQKVSLYIYYISLVLITVGLFFSRGLVSTGFISFAGNWILEGNYKEKWNTFKINKAGIIVSFIFILHLAGMIHTQNISYGLSELKIKLPLFLPFFYGSSKKLIQTIKVNYLLFIFVLSSICLSVVAFIRFEYFSDYQSVEDLFQIALIGQNIRLSLFINLGIFCLLYFLIFEKLKQWQKAIILVSIAWLIVFVYFLNSLTGYIILLCLVVFSLFFFLKENKKLIIVSGIVVLSFFIVFTLYINKVIGDFFHKDEINFELLDDYTVNGNKYFHDTLSFRTENGFYTDIYICEKELKKEWEKSSKLIFSGKDMKDQELSGTLIRYMTSKGLRKDSAGFSKLKQIDIAYIEKGCANYKYTNKYGLESRIYNILWQLNTYKQTGNATAQSISQRIEFLKATRVIINNNFWFGVGTGDVMDSFNKVLAKESKLEKGYRNRVHNQYLAEFAALGVIGFILFILINIYPIFKFKIWRDYLFSVFYIIILLSYFTDNTLETQLGVSFYSLFYSLFAFKLHEKNNNSLSR